MHAQEKNQEDIPKHLPTANGHNCNCDVESLKKENVQTLWQRFVKVVTFANKIRPKAEKQNAETDEEFLSRRRSFLQPFAPGSQKNYSNGRKDSYSSMVDIQLDMDRTCCSASVIEPEGSILYAWLTIVTVCWTYSMWMLIARQAFSELQQDMQTLWFVLDYSADFVYVLDFIVQIRTGYLENGLLVYDSFKLAKNYTLSQWFVIDILSLTPLDLFYLITGTVQPILRFPRFLKFYRAKAFARRAESRTSYPNLLRVVNLCHMLMLLMHWFACFYYMISESEGFFVKQGEVRGWAYPLPDNATSGSEWARLRRKYLHSVYWSCLTLTTIGEKQSPDTDVQYICTLFAYFLGVFVFATVVGQVGNVIANRNVDRLEFERLVDNAKMFMKTKGVSKDMQTRILRWYDYSWSRGILRGASDVNALGMIPDTLKVELAIRVNMDTLRKVSIFKLVQPEFLYALVLKMKSFVFTPGDLVCRKGEVAREMFIINHGVLSVVNDTGVVVANLKPGDFFGEIGVLNIVNGVNKRVADVVSVGYSEVFSLAGKDVLKAMEYYPDAKNLLLMYGRVRLQQTQDSDNQANADLETDHSPSAKNFSSSSESESSLLNFKSKDYFKKEQTFSKRETGSAKVSTARNSSKGIISRNPKAGRTPSSSSITSQKHSEMCALLSITGAAAAVAASVPGGSTPNVKTQESGYDWSNDIKDQAVPEQYASMSNQLKEQNTRIEAKLDYLTVLTRRGDYWSNSTFENTVHDGNVDLKKLVQEQEKEILQKDKEIENLKQDVQLLMNKLTLSMSGGDGSEDVFVRSSYPQTHRRKSAVIAEAPRRRNRDDHIDYQNLLQKFMCRRLSTKKTNERKLKRHKTDDEIATLYEHSISNFDESIHSRTNLTKTSATAETSKQLTNRPVAKPAAYRRLTVKKSLSECLSSATSMINSGEGYWMHAMNENVEKQCVISDNTRNFTNDAEQFLQESQTRPKSDFTVTGIAERTESEKVDDICTKILAETDL